MQVRLFAYLRERVGESIVPLDLSSGATVESAWQEIARRSPIVAGLRRSIRPAVNSAYATFETGVQDGDEIAFLPPVSGG